MIAERGEYAVASATGGSWPPGSRARRVTACSAGRVAAALTMPAFDATSVSESVIDLVQWSGRTVAGATPHAATRQTTTIEHSARIALLA